MYYKFIYLSIGANEGTAHNVATLLHTTNERTHKLVESLQHIQVEAKSGEMNMGISEQQFEAILHAMQQSTAQNDLMSSEVKMVGEVIKQLGTASDEVTSSADSLAIVAQELR